MLHSSGLSLGARRQVLPSSGTCLLQPTPAKRKVWDGSKRRRASGPVCFASLTEDASAALNDFMSELKDEHGLTNFMDWVPDATLDALIETRKRTGTGITDLTAHDVCELVLHQGPDRQLHFHIDSYAHRVMLYDHVTRVTPLSAISLAPEKSCHRFHVVSSAGEELILTAMVERQASLQPQYRMAPRIERTWRLRSVTGEPAEAEDLARMQPEPTVGPEAVVAAQLDALKAADISRVFQWASPKSKATTGPIGRFAQLLQHPAYQPLLSHTGHDTLRRSMCGPNSYIEVVAIQSNSPGVGGMPTTSLYLWSVQRQCAEPGELSGAWMVESVDLLSTSNMLYRPGADDERL